MCSSEHEYPARKKSSDDEKKFCDLSNKIHALTTMGALFYEFHAVTPAAAKRRFLLDKKKSKNLDILLNLEYVVVRRPHEVFAIGVLASKDGKELYVAEETADGTWNVAQSSSNPKSPETLEHTKIPNPPIRELRQLMDWVKNYGYDERAMSCANHMQIIINLLQEAKQREEEVTKIAKEKQGNDEAFKKAEEEVGKSDARFHCFVRAISLQKANYVLANKDHRGMHNQKGGMLERQSGNQYRHINVTKYLKRVSTDDLAHIYCNNGDKKKLVEYYEKMKKISFDLTASHGLLKPDMDLEDVSRKNGGPTNPARMLLVTVVGLHHTISTLVGVLLKDTKPHDKSSDATIKLDFTTLTRFLVFAESLLAFVNHFFQKQLQAICKKAIELDQDQQEEPTTPDKKKIANNIAAEDEPEIDPDANKEPEEDSNANDEVPVADSTNWLSNYLKRITRFHESSKSLRLYPTPDSISITDVTIQNAPSLNMAAWEDVLRTLHDETWALSCDEFIELLQDGSDPKLGKFCTGSAAWSFNGTYHCESVVAVEMDNKRRDENSLLPTTKVYFGVSKLCCVACSTLLQVVFGKTIEWAGTSNAMHQWALPPACKLDKAELIEKELRVIVGKEAKKMCQFLRERKDNESIFNSGGSRGSGYKQDIFGDNPEMPMV